MKAIVLQRALAFYWSKKFYLVCREVSLDTETRDYYGESYKVTHSERVRADFIAMSKYGHTVIVETKSGIADFRHDHKWQSYKPFCNKFYFCADERTAPRIVEALKEMDDRETGVFSAHFYEGLSHKYAIGLKVIRPARDRKMEMSAERQTILWSMAARNSGFYGGSRVRSVWEDDELLRLEYRNCDVF